MFGATPFALLQIEQVSSVRPHRKRGVDREMRCVRGINVGQSANHWRFVLGDCLEHKALSALLEDYPRVTIVFFATALEPLPNKQFRLVPEFDQFPPCPEGVVLAVSFAKIFERSRVLPEVGFVEQFVIRQVLALGEPAAHIIDRPDLHRALPFEIPAEHTKGARTKDLRCDEETCHRLPRITHRDMPN